MAAALAVAMDDPENVVASAAADVIGRLDAGQTDEAVRAYLATVREEVLQRDREAAQEQDAQVAALEMALLRTVKAKRFPAARAAVQKMAEFAADAESHVASFEAVIAKFKSDFVEDDPAKIALLSTALDIQLQPIRWMQDRFVGFYSRMYRLAIAAGPTKRGPLRSSVHQTDDEMLSQIRARLGPPSDDAMRWAKDVLAERGLS